MAFKIAGSMAFKEAHGQGRTPALLEPMMKVEVVVPEEYMGDVIGDINARRGRIEGMESRAAHAGHRRASCRWPRCSVTPPTLRSTHAGPRQLLPCSSTTTSEVPKSIAEKVLGKK